MERPRVRNCYVENMMEAEIVRLMTIEIGKVRQTGDITREDQLTFLFLAGDGGRRRVKGDAKKVN